MMLLQAQHCAGPAERTTVAKLEEEVVEVVELVEEVAECVSVSCVQVCAEVV